MTKQTTYSPKMILAGLAVAAGTFFGGLEARAQNNWTSAGLEMQAINNSSMTPDQKKSAIAEVYLNTSTAQNHISEEQRRDEEILKQKSEGEAQTDKHAPKKPSYEELTRTKPLPFSVYDHMLSTNDSVLFVMQYADNPNLCSITYINIPGKLIYMVPNKAIVNKKINPDDELKEVFPKWKNTPIGVYSTKNSDYYVKRLNNEDRAEVQEYRIRKAEQKTDSK